MLRPECESQEEKQRDLIGGDLVSQVRDDGVWTGIVWALLFSELEQESKPRLTFLCKYLKYVIKATTR